MNKEYKVKFLNDNDDTTVERTYKLINTSTFKARALSMKLFTIDSKGEASLNTDKFNNLYSDEKSINDFMKNILIGDHKDINWFYVDPVDSDGILNDFFTLSSGKIGK